MLLGKPAKGCHTCYAGAALTPLEAAELAAAGTAAAFPAFFFLPPFGGCLYVRPLFSARKRFSSA